MLILGVYEYNELKIYFLSTGAVCDFRLSYGRSLSRKAKIIAVNRNKGQLYRVGNNESSLPLYDIFTIMMNLMIPLCSMGSHATRPSTARLSQLRFQPGL